MKHKILFAIIISSLSLFSCNDNEVLTSGQLIIKEIQSIITQNDITEIQVRPLDLVGGEWPARGQKDFRFQDGSIEINDRYYNIIRLTEYWINDYLDDQDRQVFVLVMVMDI